MDYTGFTSCKFTLDNGPSENDSTFLSEITSLGFKVTHFQPLVVECDNPTISQIHKLSATVISCRQKQPLQENDSQTLGAEGESLGFEKLSLSAPKDVSGQFEDNLLSLDPCGSIEESDEHDIILPTGLPCCSESLFDEDPEWSENFTVGRISLDVVSGHAMSVDAHLIVAISNPFKEILNTFQKEKGMSFYPRNVPNFRENCSFWQVSHNEGAKDVGPPIVCSLPWENDGTAGFEHVFKDLPKVLKAYASETNDLEKIAITSSVLYPETLKTTNRLEYQQGRRETSKQVSNFLRSVHHFVKLQSLDETVGLDNVTIVGDEETVPQIIKLLDSMALAGEDVEKVIANSEEVSDSMREDHLSPDTQSHNSTLQPVVGVRARPDVPNEVSDSVREDHLSPDTQSHNSTVQLVAGVRARPDVPNVNDSVLEDLPSRDTRSTNRTVQPVDVGAMVRSDISSAREKCVTCDRYFTELSRQQCCDGALCQTCTKTFSVCPYCLKGKGIIYGNQPRGSMERELTEKALLEGCEHYGTYVVNYLFPDGIQSGEHPHPGRMYKGTRRVAYLPASDHGSDILYLLRLAFMRRLTFTVGRSATTGEEDVIVWSGIEHKTKPSGGKAHFGYPDKDYPTTVVMQLKQMGVTYESITEDERSKLRKYFSTLRQHKFVRDDV